MKTFNLSLAAIAAMTIVSTGNATSLQEALTSGKITGAIQAYNFSRKIKGGKDWQITTLGLDLSYETARYNGFGAKATFQASSSPWANDDAKAAKYWDMYGSGGQLSEIYLSYKMDNTTAQVGRMYFWSPVLGGSGSRVNNEAVQGLTLVNTDIPDTNVTLAYVNKIQARTEVDPGWARNANDGKIESVKTTV